MESDSSQQTVLDTLFRQIEAHQSLVHFLDPRVPLPPFRGWAISPDLGLWLVREILSRRPSAVCELGVGVSTVVTAYALERVGSDTRFTAVEDDPKYLEITRAELRAHGLEGRVELVHAPLVDHVLGGETWRWYDTAAIPGEHLIDVLVVDGPPGSTQPLARYPALPLLRDRLAPGAVVVLDDGIREDEKAIVKRWVAEEPGLRVEYPPMEKGSVVIRDRFRRISLQLPREQLVTKWNQRSRVELTSIGETLLCEVIADGDGDGGHYGGVRLPVARPAVVRLDLQLMDVAGIQAVYVDGNDARGRRQLRWHWQRPRPHPEPRGVFELDTARDGGLFLLVSPTSPANVVDLHVFLRVAGGRRAGFILHSMDVASIE